MAVVTDDQIGDDVALTVRGIAGVVSAAYPPPEQAPIQGPACWVDIGPAEIDMGNLERATRQITITVATPRKSDYPNEYRLVLRYARLIVVAFRANVAVAGEAILTAPATISRPFGAKYGETDTNNVVACLVSFAVETHEETVNQIEL